MRAISSNLTAILESDLRSPAYKVYAWDSAGITLSALASAPHLAAHLAPPLDLTPYVSDVSWSLNQLSFTIADPSAIFNPDAGTYRNYLNDGAILRFVEGDANLDESEWCVTFTGQIKGQVGWFRSRKSRRFTAKVSVFGRGENQAYKRRTATSQEWTAGTDLGVALQDVCEDFFGLTTMEIRLPLVMNRAFLHKSNQLVQVSPWDGIAAILQVVGLEPYFDGEGRLTAINKNLSRPVDLVYTNQARFVDYDIPERSQDVINRVEVTFLAANLERVDGPNQLLGTAQVTTGFFSLGETLPCWWSDDHRQRASGSYMVVIKSVNSGLLPVGSESYSIIDEFHGEITVEISVWVPILATVMIAEYLAAAAIPDTVVVPSFGVFPTIPVGKIMEAQSMIVILLLMMSIGSAQYEIWGTPYDYAYLEKQSIAIEDGLEYWEEISKEIKNDFIGSHDQADALAVTELIWEHTQGRPRKLLILDDPRLEPGDIIVTPDGYKFVILSLSKTVKKGEVPLLQVEAAKVAMSAPSSDGGSA